MKIFLSQYDHIIELITAIVVIWGRFSGQKTHDRVKQIAKSVNEIKNLCSFPDCGHSCEEELIRQEIRGNRE